MEGGMTADETLELLTKIRERWRTSDLTDDEHIAWRRELPNIEYHAARQALTDLYIRSPHHRPTIEQFCEFVHTMTNPTKLPPAQIARNLEGIARLREAWANRHLESTT